MSTENILQRIWIDPDLSPSEQLKILTKRAHDVDEVQRRLELSRRANAIETPYTEWEPPDASSLFSPPE